jgi:ketosteroid isomerase-like protein
MTVEQRFRGQTLAKVREAVEASYRSDAEPYVALWATRGPVSLFGALGPCEQGVPKVGAALRKVAARFGEASMDIRYEVVEVGTDLAYTVGFEDGELAIDGERRRSRIRVTHIYRLEDGDWRLVHRHGDFDPRITEPPSHTRS